jgi:hypothetical protein
MNDVTHLLAEIERGKLQAAESLLPLVYDELRKLARAKLAREKPGHTLDATALVHEAYLRLLGPNDQRPARWDGRGVQSSRRSRLPTESLCRWIELVSGSLVAAVLLIGSVVSAALAIVAVQTRHFALRWAVNTVICLAGAWALVSDVATSRARHWTHWAGAILFVTWQILLLAGELLFSLRLR